jgi:hypothetical protein
LGAPLCLGFVTPDLDAPLRLGFVTPDLGAPLRLGFVTPDLGAPLRLGFVVMTWHVQCRLMRQCMLQARGIITRAGRSTGRW